MRIKEADGQRLFALSEALQPVRNDDEARLWWIDELEWTGEYDYGRGNRPEAHGGVRPN